MAKTLPARPNLDHLRRQAKTLIAGLKSGDASAIRTVITHLPAARKMTPSKVRSAGFKLADAQSAVARKSGFDSWAALTRHVEQLRALEGAWHFVGLQVDGTDMPVSAMGASRLLIDGDRFRMESPEATFEGVLTIDAATSPMRLDIEFIEGPEAGEWSHGIFELDNDQLTICLGVVGATRPVGFISKKGSGHALERLRRQSAARPAGVTGGTRNAAPVAPVSSAKVDPSLFDVPMTPLLKRLEGEWAAVRLVSDGEDMRKDWLPFGSRIGQGNETKVVFGGQVMLHAKVRIDERATPMSIDYLNLSGSKKGNVSLGIVDWVGDDVRFLIAAPGEPRPSRFDDFGKGCTFSQWRKRE